MGNSKNRCGNGLATSCSKQQEDDLQERRIAKDERRGVGFQLEGLGAPSSWTGILSNRGNVYSKTFNLLILCPNGLSKR